MAISEHDIQVNNRNVHYYEDGIINGRSVLLIHGGIGSADANWSTVIPDLSENYHVIAPDLPGFGKSDSLATNSSLANIVDWVMTFLDSQGIDQIAVIGHGFGALIARFIAAQHPQVIPAVVLINGGFVPGIPSLAKTLMGLPVIGSIVTRYLANATVSDDSLNEMIYQKEARTPQLVASAKANTGGFAQLMQTIATQPIPTNKQLLVAVLIVWGLEDRSVSVDEGTKLKATIPGAKFVEIEECGHFPQLEEHDIFDWQVKDFLIKNDPKNLDQIPGT